MNYIFEKLLNSKKYFLIDLDDTLYDESQYLFPAYNAVAKYLADHFHEDEVHIRTFLKNTFTEEGREYLFNKMFAVFEIEEAILPELLHIMRTVQLPHHINLFEEWYTMLDQLQTTQKNIAVITNGNPVQQKNKIAQINWKEMDMHINFYCADEWKRKPATDVFKIIQQKNSGALLNEFVMIGDSKTDEQFAANCLIDFVQIKSLLHSV